MLSDSSHPSKPYIDMPHSSFLQLVNVIGCNAEWSSLCRLSFFFFLKKCLKRKVHLHREEQNKTLKSSFQYMASHFSSWNINSGETSHPLWPSRKAKYSSIIKPPTTTLPASKRGTKVTSTFLFLLLNEDTP